MGILDKLRAKQAERRAEGERKEAVAAEQARVLAIQQQEAREAAERQRVIDILGPDLAAFEVTTPEEAKIAIKMARLRKKEIQNEKRELAAELADVREEWRDKQAGRRSTAWVGAPVAE